MLSYLSILQVHVIPIHCDEATAEILTWDAVTEIPGLIEYYSDTHGQLDGS